jgi:hypothetical protein
MEEDFLGGGSIRRKDKTHRNMPSVRTDRSCSTNQTPILSIGSVNRNALAERDPIKFRVNMPVAVGIADGIAAEGIGIGIGSCAVARGEGYMPSGPPGPGWGVG